MNKNGLSGQSRVEIEYYSVAYLDRITALETRYL